MRFRTIVKANKDSEAGKFRAKSCYPRRGSTIKSCGLLDLAGLQPSSKGARIKFSGGKRTVVEGPFTESKELIGGYWIIQVKSREEALEWAKRAPNPAGEGQEGGIEVRQFFELDATSHPVRRSTAPAKWGRNLLRSE